MERVVYMCSNCSFEFSRKIDFEFNYCPYCGKSETVDLKTGSFATQILD